MRLGAATGRKVLCCCVAAMMSLLLVKMYTNLHPLESIKRSLFPEPDALSSLIPSFDVIGREQTDTRLIDHIRKRIVAPSSLPYNLSHPEQEDFSQYNQTIALKKYLDKNENGFFIEVGGYDGELLSNTLHFERDHGWGGLLIEAVLPTYERLLTKHRRAHSLHACLCSTNVTHTVTFDDVTDYFAKMKKTQAGTMSPEVKLEMPCFPFYSVLAAMDFPTVNLLSLDIEGWELAVLKTLPLRRLDIRLVLVEFIHIPEGFAPLQSYMEQSGYSLKEKLYIDGLFVKRE